MTIATGKLRRRLFVLTAVAGILALQVVLTPTASGRQVYRAERAAITVSLTEEGRYLRNIRVEARGRCTDGRRTTISFAIVGSGRLEVAPNGRFGKSRGNAHELRTFKGRVEDDAIRGYFRRFSDGPAAKGFEPRCGTGGPYSRRIYFVAR